MKQNTDSFEPSRLANRSTQDKPAIYDILDEGLVVHVSFLSEDRIQCIPVGYARQGDNLLLHGSSQSHFFRAVRDSEKACCLTVSLLDGLVLAKSAFHHSFNYRSVVAFSHAEEVTDAEEKTEALRLFTEKYIPGRWDDCRHPSEGELKATIVLRFSLDKSSAKVRSGPPSDAKPDLVLPHWTGIVPLKTTFGEPVPADESAGENTPSYLTKIMC